MRGRGGGKHRELVSAVCAAISGLVLYLAGRGYAWGTVGTNIGVIPVLITFAFLHGVRGAFAYHKLPPRPAGLPSLNQSFQALGQDSREGDGLGAQKGDEKTTGT